MTDGVLLTGDPEVDDPNFVYSHAYYDDVMNKAIDILIEMQPMVSIVACKERVRLKNREES